MASDAKAGRSPRHKIHRATNYEQEKTMPDRILSIEGVPVPPFLMGKDKRSSLCDRLSLIPPNHEMPNHPSIRFRCRCFPRVDLARLLLENDRNFSRRPSTGFVRW